MVKIAAAPFYARGLGHGDLYVIDVSAVPDGLEDSVGKTESHNVLDRFFAEIVVDAVNLIFFGNLAQLLVESFGRFQVVTEGLFDNDPAPVLAGLLHQSRGRELLHDGPEIIGGGGQIIEVVLLGGVIAINLGQEILQLRIKLLVVEIALEIIKAAREALPQRGVNLLLTLLFVFLQDLSAEVLIHLRLAYP